MGHWLYYPLCAGVITTAGTGHGAEENETERGEVGGSGGKAGKGKRVQVYMPVLILQNILPLSMPVRLVPHHVTLFPYPANSPHRWEHTAHKTRTTIPLKVPWHSQI